MIMFILMPETSQPDPLEYLRLLGRELLAAPIHRRAGAFQDYCYEAFRVGRRIGQDLKALAYDLARDGRGVGLDAPTTTATVVAAYLATQPTPPDADARPDTVVTGGPSSPTREP